MTEERAVFMRLLVAEDEKDLNRVITKRLQKEGYAVDSCFDGEEALDFIEMGEFDGIILDIMMPKMSGFDVLKTIRIPGAFSKDTGYDEEGGGRLD